MAERLKHVLVVDDEPGICRALKAFFESRGLRVATATTAQSALDQAQCEPAESVLLDLGLPDGSGLEVLSRLKQQCPNLRVVVISGLSDQETIQEAMQRGASRYLTKPFDFMECLYAAMGVETVDVSTAQPDPEAIRRVSPAIARRYEVLPLRAGQGTVTLAMVDTLNVGRLGELAALLECDVVPAAIIAGDVAEAIDRQYGTSSGQSRIGVPAGRCAVPGQRVTADAPLPGERDPVAQGVQALVENALTHRATNVYLGTGPGGPWVRERIDGLLYQARAGRGISDSYERVVARLKELAGLVMADRQLPQQGRLWFEAGSTQIDLHLSVLPTPSGEHVTIRILQPSAALAIDRLGLAEDQARQIDVLLDRPGGLLLVTGPGDSGTSTSLYALLDRLNTGRVNIATIEDPIERELSGVTQLQVHPKSGLTFAAGLQALLRHHPEVIMVGELRDQQTASLAVEASLAGHLVLASLHATDATGGVARLLDLGIEPRLVRATLGGVVAQRLIRLLCRRCRTAAQPDPARPTSVEGSALPEPAPARLWRAQGCPQCCETGYQGRIGIFELLVVDQRIQSLIMRRAATEKIRECALSGGMRSLRQAGRQLVRAGLTSLEELNRVLPSEAG